MTHYDFLVTGAGGLIGRHVTALLESSWFGVQGRQQCDLTDRQQVLALPPARKVFHLAGKAGIHGYMDDPWQMYQDNTVATLNMLEYARIHRCERFILAGSYLYGSPRYLPIDETHPLDPHNGYAMSKYLAEQLTIQYARDFKLPVMIARMFNVYGPEQSQEMLIPTILAQLQSEGEMILRDPFPARDFIHVEDVARAFLKMSHMSLEETVTVLNIGSGRSYSVAEVVNILLEVSALKKKVRYLNQTRAHEIDRVVADISKAQKYLEWTPEISLEEGLRALFISFPQWVGD